METLLQFPLHIHMMILFIILFQMNPICSSDVEYVNDLDTGVSLPCLRKYLSESYFEKQESLHDSYFQSYLAHQLPVCSCNERPQDSNSVLQRHLTGEGSHRHLSTSVKFSIQPELKNCQAVVIEKLPSGVFADPFELQRLVERGVFADAAVFGDANLELPSALSNRSLVEVHVGIGGLEINMELPLHARYPPLDSSGYARVEMGMPDVLLRCISGEKLQYNKCIYWVTKADPGTSVVVWRIPSGNAAHAGFVSAVTFISALLSAFLIVLSAIYSPNLGLTHNSKQS